MELMPFSVAISVYAKDNPAYFDRALESITEKQTIIPDEIVLVVDGPIPEESNSVIKKYASRYSIFNIIRLEKNGGLGNALKIAVDNAKFELIARMDSDDIAASDRFEQQLNFLSKNPKVDIVGGDISEFIDDEENIVAYRKVPTTDGEIKNYLKKRCPFNHGAVMYKKTSVMNAGGYMDLFWNEDYYLWIRMVENGAVTANTGTILVNVRTGKDMYKRRGGRKYFKSEKFLQKYMLKHKIIGFGTYISNVAKRFIVQVLLPNNIRGWVFKKFARRG